MRESLTLFMAVVLSLALCLPSTKISKTWLEKSGALIFLSERLPNFPSFLTITFKSSLSDSSSPKTLKICLVPDETNRHFRVDWRTPSAKNAEVKLFTADGSTIELIRPKKRYLADNELISLSEEVRLSPGIYYASAAWQQAQGRQYGYAKFVVK